MIHAFTHVLHSLVPIISYFYSLRCLTKNCSAIVDIELSRPVCLELYQDSKELGRFMLRYAGNTIAAGVISKVQSLIY